MNALTRFVLKCFPQLHSSPTLWYIDYLMWRITPDVCTECSHPKSSHYWTDGWGKEPGKSYCMHNGCCSCGYNTDR